MTAMIIRPLRVEDAEATAALLDPIVRAGAFTVMTTPPTTGSQRAFLRGLGPRGCCLGAFDRATDRLLGFQDVVPHSAEPAQAHVGEIATFVALDARRRGVGAALLEASVARARAAGFLKLVATIRADNDAALAFYRAGGFATAGIARRHTRIGESFVDAAITERWIAAPRHQGLRDVPAAEP